MELTLDSSFFRLKGRKQQQAFREDAHKKRLDNENDIHYHLICKIPLIPFQHFSLTFASVAKVFLLAGSIFLIKVGTKKQEKSTFFLLFCYNEMKQYQ
ncbi:hypothetical protein [Shouchella tritolerans]|uniref:hypothetical protein n=1 Tax=Shouchella tritolerans TaxID=2979466 RepID=UPI000787790C|nr:hypothetical protein [Shouchella tritolerans]